MSIKIVPDDLFSYLMGKISGVRFEVFAKQLFGLVFKETFIPMGGIHDGGADGAMSSYIQEISGKPNTFVQFTITAEGGVKAKVNETIKALQTSGRTPRLIIYATSIALPKSDLIAQEMIEKHEVMVQFRDYERIKGYVNTDDKCNRMFYDFFTSEISALSRAASSNLTAVNEYATDPTVYVYLNYELKTKHVKNHLNEQVLDALIYWSLRDTDPDAKILASRASIHDSISGLFPQAKNVLLPNLNKRLSALTTKVAGGVERLRYYKATDCFSLPFEMRAILANEASAALARQTKFRHSITDRLVREVGEIEKATQKSACNTLVFQTVHRYFIDQGLLLAAFLEGRLDTIHISDQVVEDIMVKVLSEIDHGKSLTPEMFGACLNSLRGIFYHPSTEEREYMAYLSKTSCLLVTMQSAPKLLEYFNKMGGNFRLLIGTDLIIKAISERYVEKENQQVTRILEVSKQLGSELTLTEPVLDEVFTHLHAADLEFRNHYAEQEKYLRRDMTVDSDRIMIRAYFHSRKSENGPKTWSQFIEQVVTHSALRNRSETAREELKGFLIQKFSMKFLTTEELKSRVNNEKVLELAAKLDEARAVKHENLSYNDALMAHATYAQRKKHEESGIYDGFGYRTWWLTKETHVLHFSKALVESQGNVPYIMRPEFILNFVSLAANAENVRKTFSDLLPTTAGLQLGKHLSSEAMYQLMGDAQEWGDKPPERISIMINDRANKLKHDQFKKYSDNIG
ncbi:hypothetical protein [Pseudomonas siliginis]|uniref:hypothetical protein n=1 Tax=Pseudomonas siliginis TaxID=2842346 RepID=UPI00209225E9|nr:hypothetical protein [Pseudomonas siliginis]UST75151.1 hypothetical protein NF675_03410 [Pseudomonas siliginis]UST90983.1 hypothetical protein NF678_03390 [Pseudomonas siliginis]